MNYLVKLLTNEDGEEQENVWHLEVNEAGSPAVACTGEVFGDGEGSATYQTKRRKRGGITCESCLALVRFYKSEVRL